MLRYNIYIYKNHSRCKHQHSPAMFVDKITFLIHPSGFGLNAIICTSGGKAAYNTHINTPCTINVLPELIEVPIPFIFCTISLLLFVVMLLLAAVESSGSSSSKCFLRSEAKSSISSWPGRNISMSPDSVYL
jgi:hypothetical protein